MREGIFKKIKFISKSLLWSILLYLLSMTIINWDDVLNGIRHKADREVAIVHVVPGPQPGPVTTTQIKKDIATTSHIFTLLRALLPGAGKISSMLRN
ncbi:MAG: hypothetical protein BGO69_16365 [Bacteroidetes bacterium 46-16]|nr:MAG: hypothetical protein BGO69_16365 [Bacteroidetes bacterium 46-16]